MKIKKDEQRIIRWRQVDSEEDSIANLENGTTTRKSGKLIKTGQRKIS